MNDEHDGLNSHNQRPDVTAQLPTLLDALPRLHPSLIPPHQTASQSPIPSQYQLPLRTGGARGAKHGLAR